MKIKYRLYRLPPTSRTSRTWAGAGYFTLHLTSLIVALLPFLQMADSVLASDPKKWLCGDMIDFSRSNRHACTSFLRCNGMHRWKHQNPGYRSILVIFVGFPVLTIPLAVQVSSQWVHRHPMFQQGQDAGLRGKHRGSGWPDARDRGGASAGL